MTATDPQLTSVAGLVGFGSFLRRVGVDASLQAGFDHLKRGPMTVYPMHAQLRLLIDAAVAGEQRVFGLESLASDPLFVLLAGGVVPSIDVVYDDLARFGEAELATFEAMLAEHGLAPLKALRPKEVHLDIDTTVSSLFGEQQEGALLGANPRYHGRPSYHPMLARIAETGTIVGAKLRPGNTSFGNADVPTIVSWIERVRRAVGPKCQICVRMDAAGDCTELLAALQQQPNLVFLVKADMSADLCGAIAAHTRWTTVEPRVGERPLLQTGEITFVRKVWNQQRLYPRVIAVRSRERDSGKQIYLWDGLDWTVQAFITNHHVVPAEEIAHEYNLRAGIEPLIGDLKNGMAIGKVPSQLFNANHAMLLLKLLAFNLFRRYLSEHFPPIASWRTPWARRAVIVQPGRLTRSARRRTLRIHPASMIARALN